MQGIWLIDSMTFNGENALVNYLTNAITFTGSEVTLPARYGFEETDWVLTEKEDKFFILFNSKERAFKEELKINFMNGKDYKIELISSITKIKASKIRFGY